MEPSGSRAKVSGCSAASHLALVHRNLRAAEPACVADQPEAGNAGRSVCPALWLRPVWRHFDGHPQKPRQFHLWLEPVPHADAVGRQPVLAPVDVPQDDAGDGAIAFEEVDIPAPEHRHAPCGEAREIARPRHRERGVRGRGACECDGPERRALGDADHIRAQVEQLAGQLEPQRAVARDEHAALGRDAIASRQRLCGADRHDARHGPSGDVGGPLHRPGCDDRCAGTVFGLAAACDAAQDISVRLVASEPRGLAAMKGGAAGFELLPERVARPVLAVAQRRAAKPPGPRLEVLPPGLVTLVQDDDPEAGICRRDRRGQSPRSRPDHEKVGFEDAGGLGLGRRGSGAGRAVDLWRDHHAGGRFGHAGALRYAAIDDDKAVLTRAHAAEDAAIASAAALSAGSLSRRLQCRGDAVARPGGDAAAVEAE